MYEVYSGRDARLGVTAMDVVSRLPIVGGFASLFAKKKKAKKPKPVPVEEPAKPTTPSWVYPVLIGGGAIVGIVLIASLFRGRKTKEKSSVKRKPKHR